MRKVYRSDQEYLTYLINICKKYGDYDPTTTDVLDTIEKRCNPNDADQVEYLVLMVLEVEDNGSYESHVMDCASKLNDAIKHIEQLIDEACKWAL